MNSIIKRLFKRITGNHIESNKEVVFDYDFECTRCGKRLNVKMDRQYQIDN